MAQRERLNRLLTDPVVETTDDADPPSLYSILEVESAATGQQIKMAYRRLALRYHPDKFPQSRPTPEALATEALANLERQWTQRFQQLSLAYDILSNEARRRRYDRTGQVNDDLLDDLAEEGEGRDWDAYFDEMFRDLVTTDTIDAFAATYRESAEERDDLIRAYTETEGDMDQILATVPLCTVDDEQRFRTLLDAAIADRSLPSFKAYRPFNAATHSRRRRAAEQEAKEAAVLAAELGLQQKDRKRSRRAREQDESVDGNGEDDDDEGTDQLRALIQQRGRQRMDNLLANLEAKYAAPKSKGKRARKAAPEPVPAEPSEEEFAALQAKLFGNKAKAAKPKAKKVKS
ncbi:hypothetical protein IWQ60_003847 [Tieghemiomyces parasiticus]|uniref:J domain-containing protein n=1 Tax=Tieghemiomyces parasiticus TaxID=78921 RepID=A0A9W8AFD8_9FUNG|nr:hypothetical protein IWQ60_003847 [Tieghemiomyces parasiticus]